MSFGKTLLAAFVLVAITAGLEAYDMRIAYMFVMLTLMALFFRYPNAAQEVRKLLGA